jgi:hypothetical protein
MTTHTDEGAAPSARLESGPRHWTQDLVELAALFVTVGAAHLLANLLGHQQHGPYLLIGAGACLVVVSAAVRMCSHRRRRTIGGSAAREPGDGSGLWRVRTTVADTPGELAGVTSALARRGVNILGVQLYPLADGVADEFIVEAPPWFGAGDLATAVRAGERGHTEVTRAHVRDLADLPTRALRLAGRVASDPGRLPDALGELCGPCSVVRLPSGVDHGPELDDTTMRLPDGRGGTLVVTRPLSPFTPAEYARARALVEVSARRGTHSEEGAARDATD